MAFFARLRRRGLTCPPLDPDRRLGLQQLRSVAARTPRAPRRGPGRHLPEPTGQAAAVLERVRAGLGLLGHLRPAARDAAALSLGAPEPSALPFPARQSAIPSAAPSTRRSSSSTTRSRSPAGSISPLRAGTLRRTIRMMRAGSTHGANRTRRTTTSRWPWTARPPPRWPSWSVTAGGAPRASGCRRRRADATSGRSACGRTFATSRWRSPAPCRPMTASPAHARSRRCSSTRSPLPDTRCTSKTSI